MRNKKSKLEKLSKSFDDSTTLGLLVKGIVYGTVGTSLLAIGYSAEYKDMLTSFMTVMGYVTGIPGGICTALGIVSLFHNYK